MVRACIVRPQAEEQKALLSLDGTPHDRPQHTRLQDATDEEHASRCSRERVVGVSAHDFKKLMRVLQPGVVMQNLAHPETGVKMRPHRSILRTYKNCFYGSDAVSWVEDRLLLERPQAVLLLEKLMILGFFHPVVRKHAFVDGPPVYTTDGAWETPEKVPTSLVFQRNLMDTMHHTFRTRESLPRNTYSTSTTNLKSLSHSECYYHDGFNGSSLPVHVPVLVEFCISRLQEEDMLQTEGVFRLSAPSAAVNRLAIVIGCCSDGGAIILQALRATRLSHVLAQLLKKFLSELPEGILTQEAQWLYWEIICNGAEPTQERSNSKIKLRDMGRRSRRLSSNYQKRIKKTQNTIVKGCAVCTTPIIFTPSLQESSLQESVRAKVLSLPGCCVAILHRLIVLLDAVRKSPQTKLNDCSLAAIFSPILVRKLSSDIKRYVKQVDTITDLIVFLINNHEEVFRILPSGHHQGSQARPRLPRGRVESIRPSCLVRTLSFSLECHQHEEQKKVIIGSTGYSRMTCLRAQTELGGRVF